MKFESQLQIVTAAGVPPFTVNQTAAVINLNADLLDGQHGAYYLDCANFTGTLAAGRLSGSYNINITGNAGGVSVSDSRSVVTTPQTINMGVVWDFKTNTTDGLSDGGTYFGEMTFRQYGSGTDWTGGLSHQLGFTDNGNIWQRSGSSTTWGAWKKLLDSSNYGGYSTFTGTVTGTNFSGPGTGLTGTAAALNIGGTAAIATNIVDGAVSTSAKIAASVVTYAKIQNVSVSTVLGNSSASVAQAPQELSMATLAGMLSGQTMNIVGSSTSCTGNAATATNVAWSGITSKPTTLAGFGITDALDTSATAQTKSGNLTVNSALTSGGAFYAATTVQYSNRQQIYTVYYGGGQDLNWKKIADITIGVGLYRAVTFRVDVVDNQGNFGWNSDCYPMTFFASCRRSGGVQDSYNDAWVTGPVSDYVRVVKTALGVYELQIRQLADWQTYVYTAEATINSGTVVTYVSGTPPNGSTTGTVYAPTVDWTQKLAKLVVAGAATFASQITSSVATGTAPFSVASTTAVTNLNSDLLDGQHGAYYENRDTTAVGFSGGTLTLTRATGNLTVSLDGRYLTGNQSITLSGDVTGTGTTAITTTIPNSTITNAKLNTMGAGTIKGNNGAVANSPSDLTAAQVATMLSGQTMNIAGSSTSCTGNAASASSVPWSGVTGKPTTIAGYGITDALPITGGALTGTISIDTSGSTSLVSSVIIKRSGQSAVNFGSYAGAWRSALQIQSNSSDRLLFLAPPEADHQFGILRSANGGLKIDVGGTTANQGNNAVTIDTAGTANFPVGLQQGGNAVLTAATTSAPNLSIGGSAARWATGRTISLTGDVTGTSGAFDGTAALSFAATLANSGVTAGTYRSVTVDAKGRVTAGTNPTTLSGYGITDAMYQVDPNGFTQGDINGSGNMQRLWGTDSVQNLIAFRPPTTVEYTTDGVNWTATTISNDVFDGKVFGKWGGFNMNVGSNIGAWTKVRMTWVNFGYHFFSHFTMAHSTNGHSMNFVFYKSDLNGVFGAEAYRVNGISSWPGYTFTSHVNVSGWWDTRDVRMVFELIGNNGPSGYPNNAISIGHIGIMGGYSSFNRVFDWDASRNITLYGNLTLPGNVSATGTVSGSSFSGAGTNLTGTANSLNVGGSAARWATGRTIALTGDVTATSGAFDGTANLSFAATIANSAVTYAKIQNVAVSSVLGNSSASVSQAPAALSMATLAGMLSGQTMNIAGSSTSCTGNAATATNVAWSGITSKPTTLGGFGITDAFSSSGGAITGAVSIVGQTINGQSHYQWEGATYRNPGDWTATLIARRDNSTAGLNGSIPALVLYNNNGGDQTTVGLSFASAEGATGQGNAVALAGIVARKEGAGSVGAWSSGSLNFYVKNSSARVDAINISSTGTVNALVALQQGGNQVLHAGNYSSYALPLSGGTLSGLLIANNGIDVNAAATGRIRWRAAGQGTTSLNLPFYNNSSYGSINIEVSDNDTGGLMIDNEGVTVYGAGDNGQVFRVIDEDVYQATTNITASTTFWVNQLQNGGGGILGPFTISGNTALHAGNYSSYALPLTGGTVSGVVRINNQLQVGQNTNGTAYIDAYGGYAWFGRDSNSTGIRIDGSANVHMTNTLNVVNAITQNGNQVLHAGNYSSYALPLSGGTLTGALSGTSASFSGALSSGGNSVLTVGNYSSYAVDNTKRIKQFFWDTLSASATQARRFEIARIGIDIVNWNQVGTFEIELCEQYWSNGLKKKYIVSYGYSGTRPLLKLVEMSGAGSNNFQVVLGSEQPVSGNQYYLPIYVDVRYYAYVDVRVTTSRLITSNSTPPVGYTYINTAPTPTNITDFSADSTVDISNAATAWLVGGNTILTSATTSAPNLSIGGNAAGLNNGSRQLSAGGASNWIAWKSTSADSSASAIALYGSTGSWFGMLYGDSSGTGFLNTSNGWDLRKSINGELYATVSGTAQTVIHSGNYNSYTMMSRGNVDNFDFNTYGNYNMNMVSGYIASSPNKPTSYAYGYGTVISFTMVGSPGQAQFYVSHAGNDLCFRGGWNGTSWQTWNRCLTDQNYNSYALPLSGGTVTGTLAINGGDCLRVFKGGASSITSHIYWANAANTIAYNWQLDENNNAAMWGYGGTAWAKLLTVTAAGALTAASSITASSFSGAGTGLTGTATNLNIGGNAGTASTAYLLGTNTGGNASSLQYWQLSGNSTLNPDTSWWYALRLAHGDADTYYSATIAVDFFNDNIQFRRKTNGTNQTWRSLLHSGNYNSYAPTLTGTGASGSWGISVTGSSASCTGNAATCTTANGIADGTVSTTAKLANSVVTYAKIQNVTAYTVLGNSSPSAAQAPVEINMASLASMLSGNTMNISGSSTSCSGNAATASAVAASGITGQTGMWTSAARPGPYRLYRRDDNSNYSVQTYWTGTYWRLDGYYSNDTVHAGCSVSYADSAGSVSTIADGAVSTTAKLANSVVTYAKIQNVGASSVLGNTSASVSQAPQEITFANLGPYINGVARAWVTFNENPSTGAITVNASFGISSVTRLALGVYQINFSSAFADANYAVSGTIGYESISAYTNGGYLALTRTATPKATTSCEVCASYGGTNYNARYVHVVFHR